jgi:hypothetical protein
MYNIKQYLIINTLVNHIINYIKLSINNSFKIGQEISSYYSFIYTKLKAIPNYSFTLKNLIIYQSFYLFIDVLNTNYGFKFPLNKISTVNITQFFYKFNKKLYKLKNIYIYSYLRGYYINALHLYSTNLNLVNLKSEDIELYFVLYDFNSFYLDYIYYNILNLIKFPAKIKYLKNTSYDKYSINDMTDTMPYKLVFLHKTKYYNNIIQKILLLLFSDITNDKYLSDDESYLYIILNKLV